MNKIGLARMPVMGRFGTSPFVGARTPTYRTGYALSRPRSFAAPRMGQRGAALIAGFIPLLITGALGAGTAWVGFSTGAREKGLLSVTGYVVGSLGALGALFSLLGSVLWVAGVSMIPGEMFERPTERPTFDVRREQTTTVTPPQTPSFPEFPEFPETPEF